MMKFKFAFVFLIVLAMYLQHSQGHIIPKKVSKLSILSAKAAVAKSAAAKIKLAALKKWAIAKAIVKAPFILGKKAALLKIGAVKSIAAFKLAKAKAALGFAKKKAAPVAAAFGTVTKKVGPAVAAVAAIPAAAVAAIPAVAAVPIAAVAALPAAASAALKPITDLVSTTEKPESTTAEQTSEEDVSDVTDGADVDEVANVYTIPIRETQFHIVQPDIHYSSDVANNYNEHGYSVSLLPGGEYSNVYQYYPAAGLKYDTAVAAEEKQEAPQTDTEVVVPHETYGVPN